MAYKYNIKIYKSFRQRLTLSLFVFVVAIICDSWLVSQNIISFNMNKLIGIKIGLLPIEEYIFYLVVPYMVLFLYKLTKRSL